jgi:hypothetical protein
MASSAGAATIHVPDTSFNMKTLFAAGQSESRGGAVAVDEETGYVYVMARSGSFNGDIERLDSAGNPVNYPGSPGRDETQQIQFEGFNNGDKFTLSCPNGDTTAEIVWNEVGETFQSNSESALNAKCGAGISISASPYFPTLTYEGAFAETDVPTTTCTQTSGAGVCKLWSAINGADELNVIDTQCNSSCMDIAVDNSGGPNQGVIYVSTTGSQNTCCPVQPNNESGGIQVYLPTGAFVGVIHTRSQDAEVLFGGFQVRSCGVAVDDNGDLIVAHGDFSNAFSYFDKLEVSDWGTSPDLDPPITGTIASDHANPCRSDVDSEGNVYDTAGNEPESAGPLRKYPANAFEIDPNPDGEEFDQPSKVPSQTLADGQHSDLALDEEGNVITFLTNGEFKKWSVENGSPIESFDTELSTPAGVARNNSTGTLYVTDRGFSSEAKDIWIFKSLHVPDSVTGSFQPDSVISDKGVITGELDPDGAEEVLTCEFEVVDNVKFQSTGFAEATDVPCAEGGSFSSPSDVSAEVTGLALEELHHFRLKTTNENGASLGSIHTFTPHAVIEIETEDATAITPRAATLNASFTGNGAPVEYHFEWGPTAGLGNETTPESAGSPSGPKDISTNLGAGDVEPEKTYFYRVVANNSAGTSSGETLSFTTPPAVTGLLTKPASSLDQEDITLNGEFDGNGMATTYHFEYGFDTSYGNVTPDKSAGATTGPTQISADIGEFNGFRTYHYRVVAENSFGKTEGNDETFVAPDPLNPGIANTKVVSVTPTTASVATEINPNHWATIYLFEWGETSNYGTALPFSDPIGGLENESIAVTGELTGLKPGSTYHFRAVAMNFKGTTEGENVIFTTPDLPRVDTSFANAVGLTTAHLGGKVAARGSATTVSFQYGPTAGYGQSTAGVPIGSSLFPSDVGVDLTGLTPGATYHFRLVATNGIGTTLGPDQTFTTTASKGGGSGKDCDQLSREAEKYSKEAKRLRSSATKSKGKRASDQRHRAKQFEKKAKTAKKQAKACRSTSGGNGK